MRQTQYRQRAGVRIVFRAALVLTGAVIMRPATVQAATITQPLGSSSPGLSIPTDDPAGVSDTITLSPGDMPDLPVTNLSVRVTMDHNQVGDLAISLRGPTQLEDRTEVALMQHPGGAAGFESDLVTDFPITFDDTAPDSTQNQVGGASDTGDLIVNGNDPLTYQSAAKDTVVDMSGSNPVFTELGFAEFDLDGSGIFEANELLGADGQWTLSIVDDRHSGHDLNAELAEWTLQADVVPTPSTLACGVAALGALVMIRPRRSEAGRDTAGQGRAAG